MTRYSRVAMVRGDMIQGDLQEQVMRTLWRLERGTVEEVRSALPSKYQGAYTTAQTILNRLVDRGLLEREKQGRAFFYSPAISEAEYVAKSLAETLSSASIEARRRALASLVGGLDPSEADEINALAREIARERDKGANR